MFGVAERHDYSDLVDEVSIRCCLQRHLRQSPFRLKLQPQKANPKTEAKTDVAVPFSPEQKRIFKAW
jgi:hypothetical protein